MDPNLFAKTCFLGCDPGRSGAFAAVWVDEADRLVSFDAIRFKGDKWRDLRQWLGEHRRKARAAGIEQIVPHPRRDEDGQEIKLGASTLGKLMEHYGICQGLLIAADIRRIYAVPRRWHHEFSLRTGATKQETKALAQHYFPEQAGKIFHWNAEAILLGIYASRNYCCASL